MPRRDGAGPTIRCGTYAGTIGPTHVERCGCDHGFHHMPHPRLPNTVTDEKQHLEMRVKRLQERLKYIRQRLSCLEKSAK